MVLLAVSCSNNGNKNNETSLEKENNSVTATSEPGIIQNEQEPDHEFEQELEQEIKPFINISGNIVNGGLVASDGDFIYFSNQGYLRGGYLSVMNYDGSNIQVLTEDLPYYMNVVDDYIYYIDVGSGHDVVDDFSNYMMLYRIRTDGSDRQRLGDNAKDVHVVDGWIYYISYSDFRKIYTMRLDGSERRKLCDDMVMNINVVDDFIYYINESSSDFIYRIRTDGTDRQRVIDISTTFINVVGDTVYFNYAEDDMRLYSVKADGTELTKINTHWTQWFNVHEDRIFYVSGNRLDPIGRLYSIDKDGNNHRLVNEKTRDIYIIGDRVFFNIATENTETWLTRFDLHSINFDGSDLRPVIKED